MIQLREKAPRCAEELISFSEPFARAAREHGALFILNDRPDLVGPAAPTASTSVRTTSPWRRRAPRRARAPWSGSRPTPRAGRRGAGRGRRPSVPTRSASARCGRRRPRRVGPRPGSSWSSTPRAGPDDPPWFAIGGIDAANVGEVAAPGPGGSSSCARSATPTRTPRPRAPRALARTHTPRRVSRQVAPSRFGMMAAESESAPSAASARSAARSVRPSRRARREAMAARTEAKNQAAREALEPLAEGERPTVVTVGAVISGLIALSVVDRLGGRGRGDEVLQRRDRAGRGARPDPVRDRLGRPEGGDVLRHVARPVLGGARLPGGARHRPGSPPRSVCCRRPRGRPAIGTTTLLIAGAGTMFYFMIKAMARIQMPERPRPE